MACLLPFIGSGEPGGNPWQGSLRHVSNKQRRKKEESDGKVPNIALFQQFLIKT